MFVLLKDTPRSYRKDGIEHEGNVRPGSIL
jgi:hypothetical protein